MTVPLERKTWKMEEYHQMVDVSLLREEDRVELLSGEIVKMSPIKSAHAHAVDRLAEWLTFFFERKQLVRIQNPVSISNVSEPEPDIAVVKRKAYYDAHPRPKDVTLLIEVADTSLSKDREIKLPLYAVAGIPEYWIVDLTNGAIEVYTQPAGSDYDRRVVFRAGDQVSTPTIQALPVDDVLG
ncbi:MAG: Uma2 family endonuclease [Lewinella sp.]|nr:Uma2 family endonuclease [Lewinella sp.]